MRLGPSTLTHDDACPRTLPVVSFVSLTRRSSSVSKTRFLCAHCTRPYHSFDNQYAPLISSIEFYESADNTAVSAGSVSVHDEPNARVAVREPGTAPSPVGIATAPRTNQVRATAK